LRKIFQLYIMKLLIRTFFFHILCIITFALIYFNISEEFSIIEKDKNTFVDFLLLSTTIQAGVGITDLYPSSYYSKVLVIIQQILMLLTNIITIYLFTL